MQIFLGYYLNKAHWISVKLDGEVPEEVLQNLIKESYECVLSGLPKRQREEITG